MTTCDPPGPARRGPRTTGQCAERTRATTLTVLARLRYEKLSLDRARTAGPRPRDRTCHPHRSPRRRHRSRRRPQLLRSPSPPRHVGPPPDRRRRAAPPKADTVCRPEPICREPERGKIAVLGESTLTSGEPPAFAPYRVPGLRIQRSLWNPHSPGSLPAPRPGRGRSGGRGPTSPRTSVPLRRGDPPTPRRQERVTGTSSTTSDPGRTTTSTARAVAGSAGSSATSTLPSGPTFDGTREQRQPRSPRPPGTS
jgi:hypothetical protein